MEFSTDSSYKYDLLPMTMAERRAQSSELHLHLKHQGESTGSLSDLLRSYKASTGHMLLVFLDIYHVVQMKFKCVHCVFHSLRVPFPLRVL